MSGLGGKAHIGGEAVAHAGQGVRQVFGAPWAMIAIFPVLALRSRESSSVYWVELLGRKYM
jgi:hypothetical protein